MRIKELFAFMKERQEIYDQKTAGKSKPWTQDKILQSYKFCNVYREQDQTTIWLRENWREPHQDDPYLWFAIIVARSINHQDPLGAIGYPVPWNEARYMKIMDQRRAEGLRLFSGAYETNHCIGEIGQYKHRSYATRLFTPLWQARKHLTKDVERCQTVQELANLICSWWSFSTFLSGQLVADLKFTPRWKDAPDWWTFAVSGPGSRRGLNVVFDRPPETKWKEAEWQAALQQLQKKIDPLVEKSGMPRLSAQDLQGCLCELFKYNRGYSRSKYPGNVV